MLLLHFQINVLLQMLLRIFKKQHIILIDGEKLTGYMIEYNFGVSEKKIFTIKGIDTDTFNDYVDG